VVDDGSTDGTEHIAREMGVLVLTIPHSGRAAARNAGLQYAHAETVVFAEDDAIYPPTYLDALEAGMRQEGAHAAIGPYYVYQPRTFVQRCRDLERRLHFRQYKPFSAWAFNTQVLRSLGAYDETLEMAEDVELGRRLTRAGYRIAFVPAALWYHREPATIGAFLRRRYRAGKGSGVFKRRAGAPLVPRRALLMAGTVSAPLFVVLVKGASSTAVLAGACIVGLLSPLALGIRFVTQALATRSSLSYAVGWCYLEALGWIAAAAGTVTGLLKGAETVRAELMGR